MDPAYIAAIFGLLGAIVGSASSVATILIQARLKDRRDRVQQVTALAIEHFKMALDTAHKSARGAPVLPPAIFAAYYVDLLEHLERGTLNERTFAEIMARNERLVQVIKNEEAERVKRTGPT
jgi:hypothetical protein